MALEAIAFCHKNYVVHRDIKPNNYLLAPDATLKLADFGLARIIGSPDRQLTNQVRAASLLRLESEQPLVDILLLHHTSSENSIQLGIDENA